MQVEILKAETVTVKERLERIEKKLDKALEK
jgi:tetrahydromethanopterin S-methyltransferase subunit G